MPKLKEKAPKISLPPCGGCDICGDHREGALYALGYTGKYYCKECFVIKAPDWPKANRKEEWTKNPEMFHKRWEFGESFTPYVADKLRSEGLTVVEPKKTFRKKYSDRFKYRDEIDLIVNGHRIEVKSNKYSWTKNEDYPWDSMMVDTVRKWDAHDPIPLATVIISQKTKAITVIPSKTKDTGDKWFKKDGIDRYSGQPDVWYLAKRSAWTTFEVLVKYLKGNPIEQGKREIPSNPGGTGEAARQEAEGLR